MDPSKGNDSNIQTPILSNQGTAATRRYSGQARSSSTIRISSTSASGTKLRSLCSPASRLFPDIELETDKNLSGSIAIGSGFCYYKSESGNSALLPKPALENEASLLPSPSINLQDMKVVLLLEMVLLFPLLTLSRPSGRNGKPLFSGLFIGCYKNPILQP